MTDIYIDPTQITGKIKPMHCVNNGPIQATSTQVRSNAAEYAAARIPYARIHDAAFCSFYGSEHTVDIQAVFPDFDKDPEDPASYDFTITDHYLKTILDCGTKIFYRLGSKIEHWIKKYNTLPPKDFKKWAVICEHIIMHYNEGWADGFRWNIEYWEIWNEPDGAEDGWPPEDKACWGGTVAQFYEFYTLAAKHLKQRFPSLKISGPVLAGRFDA